MSSAAPPPRPARPARGAAAGPRRRGALLPTALVAGGALLAISLASEVYTDFLWFQQLDFTRVYTTRLLTQGLLFLIGAALMGAAVAVSLSLAYRTRPVYAPVSQEAQNLDRYRESLEPLRRVVIVALPVLLGLFAGSSAAGQWQTVLLGINAQPFGVADPEFSVDIGFYVFTLPLLRFVLGFLTAVLVLSLIAAAATHYLYGGLRLQGPGSRTTRAARIQLAVLAGLLALLQAGSYFLERYSRLIQGTGFREIAGYTDITAGIPARFILAIIAVVVAALFFSTIITGNWRIPLGGIALLVVVAIVAGGVVPAVIQRFQVQPSQASREAPYIERNIAATTAAFGLDDVDTIPYTPQAAGAVNALADEAQTAASIRILDPSIVGPAFQQLEQNRGYYAFPDALDVDRYALPSGESQDTVIAVRELEQSRLPADNWFNRHIAYTHGFGVVAAAGNQRSDEGNPEFIESGIPSTGILGEYEQRIYFGEESPDFSIVGAPDDTREVEIDYPSEGAEIRNTYQADGGPSVGGLFTRLLYAIKFRDQNILLSDAVNTESQILYDRAPRDRVEAVAPFLTLDGDPYPAVVNGEVLWIVDAYTTSNAYPYSEGQALDRATTDSVTEQSQAVVPLQQREVNYIRNSVKATVNAYDGSVDLYTWDTDDPVLRAWSQAFPGAVQPLDAIDGQLMAHLRYPEDLFKVQRSVLSQYHVTSPEAFFGGADYWEVPNDPTVEASTSAVDQPPYYATLQMPEQDAPAFSLTSSYIPFTRPGEDPRNTLTGFLAVDADAGSEDGVRREGYGVLRLLQLPPTANVAGPGQVQTNFEAEPRVSAELNILRAGGATEVINGNLLTLPIGGGLLYVQPVYVQSTGDTTLPQLQRVLVSFGGRIGFAQTLDEALDQVFGGNSGAETPDAGAAGTPPTTPAPTETTPPAEGTPPPAPAPPTGAEGELAAALAEANTALEEGQAALADGDFAAYGAAQQRLSAALERAIAAEAAAAPTDPEASAGG